MGGSPLPGGPPISLPWEPVPRPGHGVMTPPPPPRRGNPVGDVHRLVSKVVRGFACPQGHSAETPRACPPAQMQGQERVSRARSFLRERSAHAGRPPRAAAKAQQARGARGPPSMSQHRKFMGPRFSLLPV